MATSKATDGPPVQHVIAHEAPPAIEILLERHGKKILVLLVLAVAAVCAAFVMRALRAERLVEASNAFTDAETIADFEAVAEEQKGTPAGGSALLMLAARHETFGKHDDARIALLRFIKEYEKHPRYSQALFDLALVSEKLEQKDEARKYLTEVASSKSELAPLALLRLAEEAAAAGDLKGARESMQGIARQHPGNPFIERIDQRIEAIDQRIILAENPPPAPEPEPEPAPTPEAPATSLIPTPGAPNTTPSVIEIPPAPAAVPEPTPETPAPEIPAADGVPSPGDLPE